MQPTTLKILLLLGLIFLGFPMSAESNNKQFDGPDDPHYQSLDNLASHWAKRPVRVDCPTPEDWANDPTAEGAWGYTYLDSNWTRIDPALCVAALQVFNHQTSDPDWRLAMSILVITH